jgi:pimeloyl-ACP methyl ester carboxylesterase
MRNALLRRILAIIILSVVALSANAQENWVSYSKAIDAANYAGHNFRLTAKVRTELSDDSAAAHLWARVDKSKGSGFFDNMDDRPIRTANWKSYTVQGTIDSGATRLAFGMYCNYNGKFYFDDVKLDIETADNKWTNIFTAKFDDGKMDGLDEGIQIGQNGFNKKYTATVVTANGSSKALMIRGTGVPNYGVNSKVGKFADVNGIKMYYEIYGAGAPLILLHGNGGSIVSFSPFIGTLMKKYKVIAIDSRSQGKSTSTNATLTYDLMASDVNALLDQLHIDSVFVWGQSDGAILGLLLVKDYPKKVKRALTYSPNIQPDSLALFQWSIDVMHKTVNESRDPKERALNQMMLDYPNIPYSELSKIKAPVLMMCGDRDVIRPEHILKMYQNIPNSQLCVLPGATHFGAWEKQELFLTIMNDFFNKPFTMPDTKDYFVH